MIHIFKPNFMAEASKKKDAKTFKDDGAVSEKKSC